MLRNPYFSVLQHFAIPWNFPKGPRRYYNVIHRTLFNYNYNYNSLFSISLITIVQLGAGIIPGQECSLILSLISLRAMRGLIDPAILKIITINSFMPPDNFPRNYHWHLLNVLNLLSTDIRAPVKNIIFFFIFHI
jgi:hypothetical protein